MGDFNADIGSPVTGSFLHHYLDRWSYASALIGDRPRVHTYAVSVDHLLCSSSMLSRIHNYILSDRPVSNHVRFCHLLLIILLDQFLQGILAWSNTDPECVMWQ